MAILDHGAFLEWSTAFENLERARARYDAAEKLTSVELRAYTLSEREKANARYLAAVAALNA